MSNITPFPFARRVAVMRYGKQAGDHVRDLKRAGHSDAMALYDAKRKFHRVGQGRPLSPGVA